MNETVVFVVGSNMFRVNVDNDLALRFPNFSFARTSTALNKGTCERDILHLTLLGTPTGGREEMPAFLFKWADHQPQKNIEEHLLNAH